jgi:hypothetical protein
VAPAGIVHTTVVKAMAAKIKLRRVISDLLVVSLYFPPAPKLRRSWEPPARASGKSG